MIDSGQPFWAACLEEKALADKTNEILKRRTFAIISHPDAGKTTLTEKFLLYGGAINLAGSVKGKSHSTACGFRLDGDREGERYFRHLFRTAVQLRRLLHQHSGYTGTSGLL